MGVGSLPFALQLHKVSASPPLVPPARPHGTLTWSELPAHSGNSLDKAPRDGGTSLARSSRAEGSPSEVIYHARDTVDGHGACALEVEICVEEELGFILDRQDAVHRNILFDEH